MARKGTGMNAVAWVGSAGQLFYKYRYLMSWRDITSVGDSWPMAWSPEVNGNRYVFQTARHRREAVPGRQVCEALYMVRSPVDLKALTAPDKGEAAVCLAIGSVSATGLVCRRCCNGRPGRWVGAGPQKPHAAEGR